MWRLRLWYWERRARRTQKAIERVEALLVEQRARDARRRQTLRDFVW